MGRKIDYQKFIKSLDIRLGKYFDNYNQHICCEKGCSSCCEKGDYPISDIELEYLMQGYINLDSEMKILVQENIKKMQKGGECPFLINKLCSVYEYRPIICRVHGLAYLLDDNRVKVPYCVNDGKNYHSVYLDNEFSIEPIKENLDTQKIISEYSTDIRNLYDWLHPKNV